MAKHSVLDDGDLRKYYAAIPHLVLEIGLNPYELALYVHFKKAAGDKGGACWKSRATIARESGMSSGMVTKARQALEVPRPELNGKPLIVVTEEPSKSGGKPTCRVTITDVWAVNMSKCSTSHHDGASTQDQHTTTTSPGDGAPVSTSPHDQRRHHTSLATSPHVPKEEPLKKNQEEDGRGYPFDHFAVAEYTNALKPEPGLAIFQAETIADAVEDAPLSRAIWAEGLELLKGNGYQARNAGNAVNRYRSEMARLAAGKRDSPVTQRRPETLRDQMLRRESAK